MVRCSKFCLYRKYIIYDGITLSQFTRFLSDAMNCLQLWEYEILSRVPKKV